MQTRSSLIGTALTVSAIVVAAAVAFTLGDAQGTTWAAQSSTEGTGGGLVRVAAFLALLIGGLLITLVTATVVTAWGTDRPRIWLGLLVVAVTVALMLGFRSPTGRLWLPDILIALIAVMLGAGLGYLIGRSLRRRARRDRERGPSDAGT